MRRLTGTLTVLTMLATSVAPRGAMPVAAAGEGPQRGELVDIGGFSLFLDCVGTGSPTVVIEGGVGGWSIHYRHIQDALGRLTRVCAYDRAGLGYSQSGPVPRDAATIADELHRLLHRAGVEPPLVLVGHSLGGHVVRIYQRRYGSEVVGLVLAEAAHEQQYARLPQSALSATEAGAEQMRRAAAAARGGMLSREQLPEWTLAPELRHEYEQAMLLAETWEAMAAETESAVRSASQVPAGDLGDLPLVVVTSGNSFAAFENAGIPVDEANAVWLELQRELAGLSSAAVHLTSPDADHRINRSDPEIVVEAVHRAVAMARATEATMPPDALHSLPRHSTDDVDRLLAEVEEAYRAMDTDAFVELFTDDFEQLDVSRRVEVHGKDAWRRRTDTINAAHLWMERVHHGRVAAGPSTIIVEIEWAGEVRGAALEAGEDRAYRYVGLGVIELRDGYISRQILFADFPTLASQLGLKTPR